MADNKIIWTELRRTLAARAGVSQKEANVFLNAFNTQLVEALKQDKQVKINGLGIFKLQAVAPRKSVNVSTGEEIIIEGYNKMAFVPEAGVKELVEKAGAIGGTAEALDLTIDPLKKLGAQAEEIVGILGELGQSPAEEQSGNTQSTKEESEPVVESAPEPVVEPEAVVEPVIEEPKVEEPKVEEPKVEEPVFVPGMRVQTEQPEPKKAKKRYHFVRDTLICVVILLMLLFAGYFFLREQIGVWIEQWMQPQIEQVAPARTENRSEDAVLQESEPEKEVRIEPQDVAQAPTEEPAQEEVVSEFMSVSADEGEDDWLYQPTNSYPRLIGVERIREGSRLAWISKKYYGSKVYWPYLFDANKDHIVNPNNIDIGTPIRIPKLTRIQLDTTHTATIATLERLRFEAEEAAKEN